MKKIMVAMVTMLSIVGCASIGDRSGIDGKQSKTRDEVRQELREHEVRMQNDPGYAARWRDMYRGGR